MVSALCGLGSCVDDGARYSGGFPIVIFVWLALGMAVGGPIKALGMAVVCASCDSCIDRLVGASCKPSNIPIDITAQSPSTPHQQPVANGRSSGSMVDKLGQPWCQTETNMSSSIQGLLIIIIIIIRGL